MQSSQRFKTCYKTSKAPKGKDANVKHDTLSQKISKTIRSIKPITPIMASLAVVGASIAYAAAQINAGAQLGATILNLNIPLVTPLFVAFVSITYMVAYGQWLDKRPLRIIRESQCKKASGIRLSNLLKPEWLNQI